MEEQQPAKSGTAFKVIGAGCSALGSLMLLAGGLLFGLLLLGQTFDLAPLAHFFAKWSHQPPALRRRRNNT